MHPSTSDIKLIFSQRIIRNDALRQSELIAKFLSPKCDDFTRTGIIAMPKHALGSAGEMAGMMILIYY